MHDGNALEEGGKMALIRPFLFMVILSFLVAANCGGTAPQKEPQAGRSLVVGTREVPPFAMKTADGAWTGISIELWRELADALDLEYELREASLHDLLEGVEAGTLDAAAAALTITDERERRFDFTHSFFSSGIGMAVSTRGKRPWLAVVKRVFSLAFLRLVAVISVFLFLVGTVVWIFERRKNPQQFGGGAAKGLFSGFWWSAVTMTTVGYGDKAPMTTGGRVVALVWMFAGIIMISSFTAAVASVLTVTQLESGVAGPGDLWKLRVGTLPDSTSEAYLQEKGIGYRTFQTALSGLRAVDAGEIDSLVYDAPVMRYLIRKRYPGSLQVLPHRLLRQEYGIALPANSPLREPLNRELLRITGNQKWQDTLYRHLGE
jgi:ABC-type amino acid transport substrate-binding protein